MWNPFKKGKEAQHPIAGRLNEILDAYAEVLSDESRPWLTDESCLPATKKEVKLALLAALASSVSEEEREHWRRGYLFLASFLPGIGPEGIRFDAQDHDLGWMEKFANAKESDRLNAEESDRLKAELNQVRSKFGWVAKFWEESDRLKVELNQIEAKLRTDKFISVLQWLRDLKP